MNVVTTYRHGTDRKSLIDACLRVFSDEDTSGNNGIAYALTAEAAKYFGIDKNNPDWTKDYTEKELENICTDKYMEQILMSLPDNTSEEDIVAKAYEMYSNTMISYASHGQDYSIDYYDNHIVAIAYAYC